MKRVLVACVVALLFFACSKKDIQKWLSKPGNPKPSVPCRIDSLYPVDEGDPPQHGWLAAGIRYNDKGNPSVINYTLRRYETSRFPVYYKYDSKNRLIEVDPPYVDPVHMEIESVSPVTPHKFVYQGNSQSPIRDSILSDTFSGVSEGTAYKVYTVKVEDLYYDAQGRINRIVTRRQFNNTLNSHIEYSNHEVKFSYDAKGNRQVISNGSGNTPPTVSYTNKPSLYSLHPVWQLVHKNWSKNAAMENVQQYNSYGLPIRVDMAVSRFLQTRYSEGVTHFLIFIIPVCSQENNYPDFHNEWERHESARLVPFLLFRKYLADLLHNRIYSFIFPNAYGDMKL